MADCRWKYDCSMLLGEFWHCDCSSLNAAAWVLHQVHLDNWVSQVCTSSLAIVHAEALVQTLVKTFLFWGACWLVETNTMTNIESNYKFQLQSMSEAMICVDESSAIKVFSVLKNSSVRKMKIQPRRISFTWRLLTIRYGNHSYTKF